MPGQRPTALENWTRPRRGSRVPRNSNTYDLFSTADKRRLRRGPQGLAGSRDLNQSPPGRRILLRDKGRSFDGDEKVLPAYLAPAAQRQNRF
jgi:hypothetical protein